MDNFMTPVPVGTNWTLLFKFHKTTLVLPIEPMEKFPEIKSKLHTALISTPNLNDINGAPLPKSANEIEFAIPIKPGDVYSGWQSIEGEEDEYEGYSTKVKGGPKNSPKGIGLKEGSIIAFRFGDAIEEDEWPVKIPTFDEPDEA